MAESAPAAGSSPAGALEAACQELLARRGVFDRVVDGDYARSMWFSHYTTYGYLEGNWVRRYDNCFVFACHIMAVFDDLSCEPKIARGIDRESGKEVCSGSLEFVKRTLEQRYGLSMIFYNNEPVIARAGLFYRMYRWNGKRWAFHEQR